MWSKIRSIWKIQELRNSILFVTGMLVIFRLVAHIPVPGVNVANLQAFISSNQIFGLLNIFSGGTIENFSIVMLGIAPYITSSIIFQLLTMVVPSLEELSKEGESGQQKINMYTRIVTVPLAALQAYGFIKLLNRSQAPIFTDLGEWKLAGMILTVTAGTIFLMWIGELITEKKIGNGISLLIFAGIVSGLPTALRQTIATFDRSQLFDLLLLVALLVGTGAAVVFVN